MHQAVKAAGALHQARPEAEASLFHCLVRRASLRSRGGSAPRPGAAHLSAGCLQHPALGAARLSMGPSHRVACTVQKSAFFDCNFWPSSVNKNCVILMFDFKTMIFLIYFNCFNNFVGCRPSAVGQYSFAPMGRVSDLAWCCAQTKAACGQTRPHRGEAPKTACKHPRSSSKQNGREKREGEAGPFRRLKSF